MLSLAAAWDTRLRAIKERWSGQLASPVGLPTINQIINQVEPLVHQMQEQHFPEAPTVVQCDGIWVSIQNQQEAIQPDKRQRKRHQRSGKKVVILVALGFWPDGRREILDWEIAEPRRSYALGTPLESSLGA